MPSVEHPEAEVPSEFVPREPTPEELAIIQELTLRVEHALSIQDTSKVYEDRTKFHHP